mmetsp:Transcript_10163/g.30527  ORF Transcript_10163/g.30527 Transcript_10163/m.30527 type:complete len:268 (-) Transcript_10163:1570-2373(-)
MEWGCDTTATVCCFVPARADCPARGVASWRRQQLAAAHAGACDIWSCTGNRRRSARSQHGHTGRETTTQQQPWACGRQPSSTCRLSSRCLPFCSGSSGGRRQHPLSLSALQPRTLQQHSQRQWQQAPQGQGISLRSESHLAAPAQQQGHSATSRPWACPQGAATVGDATSGYQQPCGRPVYQPCRSLTPCFVRQQSPHKEFRPAGEGRPPCTWQRTGARPSQAEQRSFPGRHRSAIWLGFSGAFSQCPGGRGRAGHCAAAAALARPA